MARNTKNTKITKVTKVTKTRNASKPRGTASRSRTVGKAPTPARRGSKTTFDADVEAPRTGRTKTSRSARPVANTPSVGQQVGGPDFD